MKNLILVITFIFGGIISTNAHKKDVGKEILPVKNQVYLDASKKVAEGNTDFHKRIKNKSYKEIKVAEIPKDIRSRIHKKYKKVRIKNVLKNKEGVFGVVLFHPQKRKISPRVLKQFEEYKRTQKRDLELDLERQVVFLDDNNWADENNFPSDIFAPSGAYFPSDIFIPGGHLFPSDIF